MKGMSFTVDFEDLYDPGNATVHRNITPFMVNPETLSCEARPLAFTAATALFVIQIGIFLLAIPGNLLVALVITANRHTMSTSDFYLLHLAIADALLALSLPFWAVAVIRGWIFGDFLCKFISLILEATFYTSIIFLACISVDRYLVIVHATESYRYRQRMWSRVICASTWALGSMLSLPALFSNAFRPDEDSERVICSERYNVGSPILWRLATRGLLHVLGFLLPLVVMVTCYSITIARLMRTHGFQKHRAMRVIIMVVVAFLLCWTPHHLAVVIDTLMRADLVPYDCARRSSLDVALLVTHGLALSHSCINPVLYAFIGKKFRTNLRLLVQRKMRQDRVLVPRLSRSTSQTSEGNGAVL